MIATIELSPCSLCTRRRADRAWYARAMRLPPSLLSRVRGPVAVLALAGCGAPVATEPEPIVLVAEAPAVVEAPRAIDPVAYDRDVESARLDRVDHALESELDRRTDRIASAERAARPQHIGIGRPDSMWMAACGRG
jgi:hypothetical protein